MIISRCEITPTLLVEILDCDFQTGKLFWRPRDIRFFASENSRDAWNAKHVGKEAFATRDAYGYFRGSLLNFDFFAHRVVWAMYHGEWPQHQIDHINGNKLDNRISNLRDVTYSENAKNMPLNRRNKSGIHGVTWCRERQKWFARITIGNKCKNLGRFTDKNDAIAARKTAEGLYGFHENHGRTPLINDPMRAV